MFCLAGVRKSERADESRSTPALSPPTASYSLARDGSQGGGEERLQSRFLRPEKGSDSGPEVSPPGPDWTLVGGSRTTAQCSAGLLSAVCAVAPIAVF